METKERPILFSGPMVRAILEGRKTQTRRVVKNTLGVCDQCWIEGAAHNAMDFPDQLEHLAPYLRVAHCPHKVQDGDRVCPPWSRGDRLWVRESCYYSKEHDNVYYSADHLGIGMAKWYEHMCRFPRKSIPSIHMPRWASRITLEVVSVRVERVQEISESDAKAEGLEEGIHEAGDIQVTSWRGGVGKLGIVWSANPCSAFADLWDSINAKRGFGWSVNPWVWVIEFGRVEGSAA